MYFHAPPCRPRQPYSAESSAESIMVETTRLRDACILLAGHRAYREYPMTWTERMLEVSRPLCR